MNLFEGIVTLAVGILIGCLTAPTEKKRKGRIIIMFQMKDTDNGAAAHSAAIAGEDAAGNPAPVQGVTWVSSDEAIVKVTPAADGQSAVIEAVGKLGPAQLQLSAVNPDGTIARGTADIEVIASDATTINVTLT